MQSPDSDRTGAQRQFTLKYLMLEVLWIGLSLGAFRIGGTTDEVSLLSVQKHVVGGDGQVVRLIHRVAVGEDRYPQPVWWTANVVLGIILFISSNSVVKCRARS